MAVSNPKVMRQQVFAAKVESTTGTAESLSGTDGTAVCYDTNVTPNIELVKRPAQSNSSQHAGVPGAFAASVTLRTELAGSGTNTAEPPIEKFLLAAGMAVATSGSNRTYTPATGGSNAATLTCAKYIDGRKLSAAGCVFDMTMSGETGKPVNVTFTGQGVYQSPTATANITPTFHTVVPPRLAGGTFTIGGSARKIRGFELAMGNKIYVREDITATNGLLAGVVTDREITITVEPEADDKDWHADFAAGTEAAIDIVVGSTAGNKFHISAPKAQLTASPEPTDRNGVYAEKLVFQCNRNSAGDDELSISHE